MKEGMMVMMVIMLLLLRAYSVATESEGLYTSPSTASNLHLRSSHTGGREEADV